MAEILTLAKPVAYDYSDWLPYTIRIIDIQRSSNARGLVDNQAKIVGGHFEATLTWTSQHADIRLKKGALARVEWPEHLVNNADHIAINRLVVIESVDHSVNLFETIPSSWIRDVDLTERAKALWQGLPRGMQAFFNELFWDSGRFHRFLFVPASINGHHNQWHGNFKHAIEVAELAQHISAKMPGVCQSVLVLAALIHDAAKGDEYRWNGHYWQRTEAGSLIGHKDLLKGWMGEVLGCQRNWLTEPQRLGLWHTLFSARNAPAYLDIRESCMLEADILSMADRLSGSLDLHQQVGNNAGGFGTKHDHLRAKPYRLPDQP